MADHNHDAWEVYDVATSDDLRNAVALTEGVRFDLGQAEERIRELETEVSDLRHDVAELRLQSDDIADLKQRVQTLAAVLSAHLAAGGLDVAAKALGEVGDTDV
jgi:TolA-binding protein